MSRPATAANGRLLRGAVGLAAALATAAASACTPPATRPDDGRAPEASASPSPEPSKAAVAVEVPLRQVVQFVGPARGPAAPRATFQPPTVRIGKSISASTDQLRSVALAFEPVGFLEGRCLRRATVTLPLGTSVGDDEVRAYPSAALSLAEGRLPPEPARPTARLDNRPYGAESVAADGTRSYDVTELVRIWASGGRLPAGRTVPDDAPFVVLLRTAHAADGHFDAVFDVAAHPPSLRVEPAEQCVEPIGG